MSTTPGDTPAPSEQPPTPGEGVTPGDASGESAATGPAGHPARQSSDPAPAGPYGTAEGRPAAQQTPSAPQMPAAPQVPGATPGRRSLPQPVLAGMLIAGSLGGIAAVMAGTLALLSPSAEEASPVNAQARAGVSGAFLAPTVGPGGTGQPLTAAVATAPPPDPAAPPVRPLTLTPKKASTARMTLARAKGRPVRIRIPAIGVSAPVEPVGVDAKGEIEVPPLSKPNLVGWYRLGPAPGEQGPAIILGHVNTRAGAAVFSRLRELKRGNKIAIRRADGKTAIFTVDGVEQVSKLTFPTKRVYGNTATASLRLITCGGLYDAKTHHYTDNVIVYATLTSVV